VKKQIDIFYFLLMSLSFFFSIKEGLIAQEQTVGLFLNDSSSYQGYTLFIPKTNTTTYLIDNMGRVVHTWEGEYNPAASAYFLEDGTLLRSSLLPDTDGNSGGFRKVSWNGEILWEVPFGLQHHDLNPLPNGNVIMITTDVITKNEAIAMGRDLKILGPRLRSLHIVEVKYVSVDSSEIVWEWWARDHFIQEYDSTKANYGIVSDHPELINFNYPASDAADWLHPNSIDYNENLDQVMVSVREISEIWIIDHSTTTEEAASHSGGKQGRGGDLLYRWGNPQAYNRGDSSTQILYRQHNATWIKSDCPGAGNITIFNNGLGRPEGAFSMVEEITPPVDTSGYYYLVSGLAYGPNQVTWRYPEELDTNFFSPNFSSAQRLPNGNTLICSGANGTFFEVTSEGKIVWWYVNPVTSNGPLRQNDEVADNAVYRCYRYSTDFPGFKGLDLTPGDPIELHSDNISDKQTNQMNKYKLYRNYPNPFNCSTTIDYYLPENTVIRLLIYDLKGNKINTLVHKFQTLGHYQQQWDGTDYTGKNVSSGIYLVAFITDKYQQSNKILFLK